MPIITITTTTASSHGLAFIIVMHMFYTMKSIKKKVDAGIKKKKEHARVCTCLKMEGEVRN